MMPRLQPSVAHIAIATAGIGISLIISACGGLEEQRSREAPATIGSTPRSPTGSGPTIRLPKSTTPTIAGTPGTATTPPEIAAFDVDAPVPCTDPASTTTAEVRYSTVLADRVVFVVDDRQLDVSPPPSGSVLVDLPCDARTHYVLMIAADPWNRTATDTRHFAGGLRQPGS